MFGSNNSANTELKFLAPNGEVLFSITGFNAQPIQLEEGTLVRMVDTWFQVEGVEYLLEDNKITIAVFVRQAKITSMTETYTDL